jgi:calcineurin-like phosphoesterase family protein
MNRFEHITQQMMIKIDGENIYLNHFPFLCYPDSKRHTVYQFFGHVHSGPLSQDGSDISRLVNLMPNQYDVGVDNNNFTPVSFQEIKQKIGQKN